jgi:hypothetical protein
MSAIFNETERKLITVLAEEFEKGDDFVREDSKCMKPFIGDDPRSAWLLIDTLEAHGFVKDVTKLSGGGFHFLITLALVQEARAEARRQEERADLVDQIKDRFRRNPYAAWAITAVAVISAALVVLNQVVQLLQNLGWIPKP